MKKTPVVLICANRFNYFTQVYDSIWPQLDGRDLFVFVDYCGDRDLQLQHQKYILRYIPGANIILRDKHYGCGKNIIDARRFIFETEKAKRAFILEDDLVLSDNYFTLCENILKWASKKYTNVGAVQAWNHCLLNDEEKNKRYDEVYVTYYNWWGYLITKNAWLQIRDYLYEFENRFLSNIPHYNFRNHKAIDIWMRQKQISSVLPEGDGLVSTCNFSKERLNKCLLSFVTGQDQATMRAFLNAGLARISTIANRSLYIGKSGVHKTPYIFKKMGYEEISIFSHKDDGKLTKFRFGE